MSHNPSIPSSEVRILSERRKAKLVMLPTRELRRQLYVRGGTSVGATTSKSELADLVLAAPGKQLFSDDDDSDDDSAGKPPLHHLYSAHLNLNSMPNLQSTTGLQTTAQEGQRRRSEALLGNASRVLGRPAAAGQAAAR